MLVKAVVVLEVVNMPRQTVPITNLTVALWIPICAVASLHVVVVVTINVQTKA